MQEYICTTPDCETISVINRREQAISVPCPKCKKDTKHVLKDLLSKAKDLTVSTEKYVAPAGNTPQLMQSGNAIPMPKKNVTTLDAPATGVGATNADLVESKKQNEILTKQVNTLTSMLKDLKVDHDKTVEQLKTTNDKLTAATASKAAIVVEASPKPELIKPKT